MLPRRPKPTDKLSSSRRKFSNSNDVASNHSQSNPVLLEYEVDDEVMWLDEMDDKSISSDGDSASLMCTKLLSSSQQQPWNTEEINLALYRLPAGEAAFSLISTIQGESLDNALEEVRHYTDRTGLTTLTERKLSIPCFANGGIRKASLAAENDEAASSKPGLVFAKWPETCLLASSWLGQYELVKVLLERGVNVKTRDGDGRTPLHLAACSGSSKIIEELLKAGADPNDWDDAKEYTALHCSAAIGDATSMKLLMKFGGNANAGLPGRSPLHYAVLSNVTECVEILLKAGACPNNPQVYTETPLHVAAGLGASESLTLLLSHGADVRVQCGAARSTPLHLAAEDASPRCTKLLLDSGAPWEAKDSRGRTAMHLAALAQSAETLEQLIQAGANPNAEDNDGRTPLHTAVAKALGSSELVRMLIQAGSEVNKPDKFGYMPLHIAALNESSQVVILLLSKGADVTARTKGGVSALSFIIRRTPEVIPRLVARLDQAITLHDHELGDVDCELRLDFRVLVPGLGRGETDLMLCLVEVGQRHILRHPLCESFLYLKWLRIRKFFLFSLIFHSIFVAIFTAYVAVAFLYEGKALARVLFWPVGIFTCMLTCKEIFQLAHGVSIYAKRWENWLQWGVIVVTCAVLLKSSDSWQHHAAALGILLVWIELMMIIGRFPMFGLYVQMFTQVAINFFKFLGAYICLIVGFSLGFSVLHKNYKSFENPIVGLLKTIIMMSGELEFEDVFFDKESKILYPGTSHLLLLVFVVLVTIILTNLMVGLAVSDIQELRRSAGLDRLVRRAELVAHLESMLFSKLLDRAPRRIVRACRRGALLLHPPHYCAIHIRPNDPRENRLPRELIRAIYRLVTERKTRNKCYGDSSNRSVNNVATSGDMRISRLYSVTSASDANRQQLTELAGELKRSFQNIGLRLDALTLRVENIARELDLRVTPA
ncbi:transient receptor potential channel pyrexia [Venturia canescens]|uniref:transient receptor potential channel pyrexia n=1 Tax=Venturia canescens TaxID=32260 RepID=UPI001C9D1276|nr:transient receptor potential channel pyrexia-like [Venturia canescens]